ncbi:MAG: ThuA domain-containing protein [Limnochordia bacterium]|nr:ThuA domain-containing protein [Limnochordia bacterium]MDD2629042.1 ThuA domain-containing protein [Limnochordia bacterium]MDD4517810.1 ThuA domain-containing protein [Limnochordia bacterium]
MPKKALIVQGGWDGHEPVQVSEVFQNILTEEGFEVELADTLDAFLDEEKLRSLHLIVPVWTMGNITSKQVNPVLRAVESGVGIAGCHGGMCDAFRDNVDWQFMTGGNWVAHPGNDGTEYVVNIKQSSSPIIAGIKDFTVRSEQYYLHVDPAVEVLATTRFPVADGPHVPNGSVDMPVVWTKRWGLGRVFYCSLGHHADIVAMEPVATLMRRGFLWAAAGKDLNE